MIKKSIFTFLMQRLILIYQAAVYIEYNGNNLVLYSDNISKSYFYISLEKKTVNVSHK